MSRGLISFPSVDLLSGSQNRGVLLPPAVAARRQHRKRSGHYRHSPSALVRSCSSSGSPSMEDREFSLGAAELEHKSQDHWSKPHRRSAGPRLFLPYLEESRALLEKRVAESPDQLSSLINHHPPVEAVSDRFFTMHRSSSSSNTTSRFPDALYMVDGVTEHGASCSFEDLDTSEISGMDGFCFGLDLGFGEVMLLDWVWTDVMEACPNLGVWVLGPWGGYPCRTWIWTTTPILCTFQCLQLLPYWLYKNVWIEYYERVRR